MNRTPLALLFLTLAAPASAEVVSAGPNGFEIRHQAAVAVPPAQLWAAIGDIGGWWNPSHSYSGDAANLRLELRPGGCFCETTPKTGGGIEHMRVTFVVPNERAVMTGSLGPLLFEATAGVMDIRIEGSAASSRLTLTYRAAGFATGNGAALAGPVDAVLGEQVKRLRSFAVGGGGKAR